MGIPGRGRRMRMAYALSLSLCGACASIPRGQYGVTNMEWTGVDDMSDEAIEACLVTREREATVIRLGLGSTSCGVPPFDSDPPKLKLWTNPWIEWPTYDPAIFDLDKERILRWYRARGYYDTRVLGVRTYVDDEMVADPVECDPDKSSCEIEVAVQVQEGEPVRVGDVQVQSSTTLPADVLEQIEDELTVTRGKRFDESDYEADKETILALLKDASFARAKVSGSVAIDRVQRSARVTYQLEPGPACVFGRVTVEGSKEDVPELLIIQAADIREGAEYSEETLRDAEMAIFNLGVFSSVQLQPQGEGSRVDLLAKVRIGRIERWTAGFGVMSGTLVRSFEQESVPQWDVHLVGSYDNKNFLGGLRRLRIEDRPRLIFLNDFPRARGGPRLGNVLSVRFEQPAAVERRTTLFVDNVYDYGPDAYQGFFRHDLGTKVGLARPFWRHRIQARVAVGHDLYEVTEDATVDRVSSYRLPFLEQQVTLDLRNDPQRPRRGLYAAVNVQEAFRIAGYGSWDYVRVTPDVRGYVPLMWDFVLAARFALGAMFIQERVSGLDDDSDRFGPQSYRIRGGGANSNRGFAPGTLGMPRGEDPEEFPGGIRRWEASLELRIPLGQDFGTVLFGDMGDVGPIARIRFERLNTALGFGLRYHTILGAIRLDLAWRVPGWQVVGGTAEENEVSEGVLPTAFHLTIGEAF